MPVEQTSLAINLDEQIINSHHSKQLHKINFLNSLAGVTKKYKRWTGSPLRYGGGKSLATGHIVEKIPSNIKRLISPFFGGGSIEIACANNIGIEVIGYDIFEILTNYWQVQLKSPFSLYDKLNKLKPTKETYHKVKLQLKKHWDGEELLPADDLATHFYFNHNLSYGPGFLGWMSSIYADSSKYEKMIAKVKNFSAPNLQVSTGDFDKVISKHNNDFLYCDPPYYLEGDSKMFKGIYPQRNFPIYHNHFKHKRLCELLHEHQGGFVLSYNDCSVIREWYKKFDIIEVAWQYTMGQGETRIGINRQNGTNSHIKKSHELLIVKH